MGKLVLIIVLAVLAIVLVAAIRGKSPSVVFMEIIKKIKEIFQKSGKSVPKPPVPEVTTPKDAYPIIRHGEGNGTIGITILKMLQISDDAKVICEHQLLTRAFNDENDQMVGISVSRPDAENAGINLYGKLDGNKKYDMNDRDTYNAFTVNSGAITLGVDEDGFYGQVTNKNAVVYVVDDNNTEKVSYDEMFDIKDGTHVLIGNQWLKFAIPVAPTIPKEKAQNVFRTNPVTITASADKTDDEDSIGKKIIGARKPVAKTVVVPKTVKKENIVTYGFPNAEDDF